MLKKKSKIFKSEDSKFYLKMGMKFLAVSFANTFVIYFLFSLLINLNKTYFISQGYSGAEEFTLAYYDFVFRFIIDKLPHILVFNVFIFFCGVYTASILIRPFKTIALHCIAHREEGCDKALEGDKLNEYKVLRVFTELFFSFTKKSLSEKKLEEFKMPSALNKVREFDTNRRFLLKFMLLFSFTGILTIWFVGVSVNEIHSATLDLAFKILPANKNEIFQYLNNSLETWRDIRYGASVFMVCSYFLLTKHIYGLVSGASLSYFLTMKAFVKGNYKARVHLVEFKYIRPYARHFNKYLDFFCRELKINEKKE